jgi:hypothetical protein
MNTQTLILNVSVSTKVKQNPHVAWKEVTARVRDYAAQKKVYR